VTEQPQSPEDGQQAAQPVSASERVTESDWSSVAVPDAAAPPPMSAVAQLPPSQPASAPGGPSAAADRPEIPVGAAFAGGLLLALILKRLAR
jgi:hypothetical protein